MPIQKLETRHGTVIPSGFTGYNIESGPNLPDPHRLRFYVMGLPGSGKTNWGASIPDAIIIDVEDSARFVTEPNAVRFVPKDGADLIGFVKMLCSRFGKHGNNIKHVVFDTVDSLRPLVIPYLTDKHNLNAPKQVDDIREFGKEGAGWAKVNRCVVGLFQQVYAAGYGWTALGHVDEISRYNPTSKQNEIVYRPSVNDGIKGELYKQAQYVAMTRPTVVHKRTQVKTTSGAMVAGPKEQVKTFTLDLTSPETSSIMTQMVKDRLGHLIPITYDITGPDGWSKFAGPYIEAKDQVNKS